MSTDIYNIVYAHTCIYSVCVCVCMCRFGCCLPCPPMYIINRSTGIYNIYIIYIYRCIYIYTSIYIYIYLSIYIYIYIYMYRFLRIYIIYIYKCPPIYACVCVQIWLLPTVSIAALLCLYCRSLLCLYGRSLFCVQIWLLPTVSTTKFTSGSNMAALLTQLMLNPYTLSQKWIFSFLYFSSSMAVTYMVACIYDMYYASSY